MAGPPLAHLALGRLALKVPRRFVGSLEMFGAGFFAFLVVVLYVQAPQDRLGLVLELLLCLAAGLVGRWPIPATLALGILMISLLGADPGVARPSVFAALVAVASLGARGHQSLSTGMAAWFVTYGVLSELAPPKSLSRVLMLGLGWALFGTFGWVLGQVLHRIARAETASRADRRAAVVSQRRSIARDLHDTVAYGITSMILRAEQVKLRGLDDPELAADLDYMIVTGRRSMRDLRGMLEELRRTEALEEDDSAWQVGTLNETLSDRVAALRRHGFTVTVSSEADLSGLPAEVRETLSKVIVEATSNIAKHGDPAGPCSILMEVTDAAVEIVFINRPRPVGDVPARTAGLGLVGVQERLADIGGELEVSHHESSFVLRVLIPMGKHS